MTSQGEVLGYVATADDPVTAELNAHDWPMVGVFLELPLTLTHAEGPRAQLISELHRIWQLQWIASQKLAPDGTKAPYAARNGGGYTLEAALGIHPNGYEIGRASCRERMCQYV